MNFIKSLNNIENIVDIFKIYLIVLGTFYLAQKIINNNKEKKSGKNIFLYIILFIVTIISKYAKELYGFSYGIISMIFFFGITFSYFTKNKFIYSLTVIVISLSINYILFFLATAIGFFPNVLFKIYDNYIGLSIIASIYVLLEYVLMKIKKIKKGVAFLENKLEDESYSLIVFDISLIIIFIVIVLSNYEAKITREFGIGLIIFSIIMFLTIQKSLQLYYKQKLLIQELNETKNELENKKKEIEELEKENLNFSKTSHSIAHKQKVLEYKLNELMLKNEIAEEIDLKKRINTISKEISERKTEIELSKTDISEIDNMLKYMQSECIKNKIDFQLQINGNIYYMINNYISKEELEILLADHIKNAIIAINNCENINKSILVRLGEIDGIYGVYVYDSGIEFEKDTLINLGKKPVTTHAYNGGTGMGFMNTFDALNKYRASITIEEYNKPCKEDFTKLIKVEFDNKNEYTIVSYRYEEIKENCEKSCD